MSTRTLRLSISVASIVVVACLSTVALAASSVQVAAGPMRSPRSRNGPR